MTSTAECTVVVTPRDRFSTTEKCLECIAENTPETHDLIIAMGGAPDALRKKLEADYRDKARLIFEDGYRNTAQLRNAALRIAKTRLAAFVDTDVYVRPGWLGHLIACQKETGAAMVVPLMLDRDDLIHTAGNDLFITHENGKAYARRQLRFVHMPVREGTNLKRCETDFGEVHSQLVVVKTALDVGIYDEDLIEGSDIDSGLALSHAGCKMYFEPKSMVYLYYPSLMDNVDDARIYIWKWDIPAILKGYDRIYQKWGVDIEGMGKFTNYLVTVNNRVGFFTRLYPSKLTIWVDGLFYRAFRILKRTKRLWVFWKNWRVGFSGRT